MATRWYRAPEIMLNWMHYNQTGDGSPTGRGLWRGGWDPEADGAFGTGQALRTRPSEKQGTAGPGLTLALPMVPSGRGLDVTVGPWVQPPALWGGAWGRQTDGHAFSFSGHLVRGLHHG